MAYFDRPTFSDDPAGISGLGCGAGCSCRNCRDVTARLGERYVPETDDDDDGPEEPARPAARPTLPPTRLRSGMGEWTGYGESPGSSNRVVFIPGIMGSALSARVGPLTIPVWGTTAMLAAVTGPIQAAAWRTAMASGDGITNGGVVTPSGLTLVRLPAGRTIDPYSAIMRDLRATFGAANVMEFPYDWRLVNEHNAGRLRTAILRRWPDAAGNRVTLLCHSMGGLVARALVETLGGSGLVQRVITVGTPHFGAPEALVLLANAGVSTFVAPFLGLLGALGSAVLTPFVSMVRNYGGLMQLLPGFDCLTPRGGAGPEPISRTYVRIRTDPFWTPVFGGSLMRGSATRSVRALNRALNGAVPTLDATLGAGRVRYDTVASINLDTTVGVREVAGPVVSSIRARCGDGSVPVTSGALPAGANISPLFISSSNVHNDLFNDAAVRSLCLGLIRGTPTPSPVPQPGCATIPAPRTGLEGSGLGCGACLSAQMRAAGLTV